jgi:glyoxylase-like metal-dependent hydrolase (beta-lactamase superfamily II)
MSETPNETARGVVSSYAIKNDKRLLLFDPLAVPSEIEELAVGSEAVVVLTCPWHERDARSLAERLGAPVFTPARDDGSPDVAWLVGGDRNDAHLYSAGDRLPVGVEALPGRLPNDVVLWMESRRAVIAGDTLVDFGQGLEVPVEWLPQGVAREQIAEGLRSLLDLPGRGRTRDTRGPGRQGRARARARLTLKPSPVARQLISRVTALASRGGLRNVWFRPLNPANTHTSRNLN